MPYNAQTRTPFQPPATSLGEFMQWLLIPPDARGARVARTGGLYDSQYPGACVVKKLCAKRFQATPLVNVAMVGSERRCGGGGGRCRSVSRLNDRCCTRPSASTLSFLWRWCCSIPWRLTSLMARSGLQRVWLPPCWQGSIVYRCQVRRWQHRARNYGRYVGASGQSSLQQEAKSPLPRIAAHATAIAKCVTWLQSGINTHKRRSLSAASAPACEDAPPIYFHLYMHRWHVDVSQGDQGGIVDRIGLSPSGGSAKSRWVMRLSLPMVRCAVHAQLCTMRRRIFSSHLRASQGQLRVVCGASPSKRTPPPQAALRPHHVEQGPEVEEAQLRRHVRVRQGHPAAAEEGDHLAGVLDLQYLRRQVGPGALRINLVGWDLGSMCRRFLQTGNKH